METALPKHKSIRDKPQTDRIKNLMHGCGAQNPNTNLNYSKYELGLHSTIIQSRIIRT